MKKLYTAILFITLALFISCDEKKVEDDIKKAFTKITDKAGDVVDKATPKPQGSGTLTNTGGEDAGGDTPPPLTKPAVNKIYAKVGEVITFPKVAGYSYALKETTSDVTLSDVMSDTTKKQVSSTVAKSGIIIVATKDGNSIDSEPIEFFTELIKPVLSSYRVITGQVTTLTKVPGYTYALKMRTSGVHFNDVEGDTTKTEISATEAASGVIIVATFNGYTIESNPIEFVFIELTKPTLSTPSTPVGTPITFPKVEGHTYKLKEAVNGVSLSDVMSDTTKKQVSSTEVATFVIVVATFDGRSTESDPIDFYVE